jgi:hypothetical protein
MDDGATNRRRSRISSGGGEFARLALAAAFAVTGTAAALGTAAPGTAAPATRALGPPVLITARKDLCVTEGEVTALGASGLAVDSPKMRAFLNRATGQSIEARFKYLGATAHESPLGSGEVRRQFGLKLEAQDACNLLYAMWRIEPEAKLVVSVKTNPGEHSSTECGNRGYRNLKPARYAAVPSLRPGDTHTLRAELSGTSMRVLIDGHPVWEGEVGAETVRLAGPVGLRSDNARLEIELRTAAPLAGPAGEPKICPTGGAESE